MTRSHLPNVNPILKFPQWLITNTPNLIPSQITGDTIVARQEALQSKDQESYLFKASKCSYNHEITNNALGPNPAWKQEHAAHFNLLHFLLENCLQVK